MTFCLPQCSLSGSGARPRNWFAENTPKPTQGNKFSASSCRCLLLSAPGLEVKVLSQWFQPRDRSRTAIFMGELDLAYGGGKRCSAEI